MNSFYFTHDYNAANDSKILFLRQQLGMEGYGIYWFIIEQLAQSGGYLPIKDHSSTCYAMSDAGGKS